MRLHKQIEDSEERCIRIREGDEDVEFEDDVLDELRDEQQRLRKEIEYRTLEYEKKRQVRKQLAALRSRCIFDDKSLGLKMAQEIITTFLEKNVLHFRDARLMKELLNTPFPCGSVPKDHVWDIVAYMRCEDFLEKAG
ncbi:hypothetical protein G6011_02703 [Alternaria panax]|uniref:Uncharacterized protein n=1 Tax=Alternaria panax TaxID=48097 RepID=A0AAD4I5J7_9PLEO|nr:hypothetical protein G6011_02703 [Alternaria panax]